MMQSKSKIHFKYVCTLISISNGQGGWNKRREGAKVVKSINVEV